tara:strand:+ start:3284 stop:4165 length:882 start_codon:yes stop_codon:yes gene_type:complete
MLKVLLRLLFLVLITSQLYSQNKKEKILFIGHAYGSHTADDKTLDPLFLEFNSKYGSKYGQIVLGGDFIFDCQDEIEFKNFIKFYRLNTPKLVIGGHDNCKKIFNLFKDYNEVNFYEKKGQNLFFYLNTNIKSNQEVDLLYDYVINIINMELPQNVIIFSHQLIYSESDWYVRTNSRGFYEYGNKFYKKIYSNYYKNKLNFYLIAGDIGAFPYTPYAFYDNDENFNLLGVGIGNSRHYKALELELDDDIKLNFIDLKSGLVEPVNKYSKFKIQIYQFPKLFLSRLKKFLLPTY